MQDDNYLVEKNMTNFVSITTGNFKLQFSIVQHAIIMKFRGLMVPPA